jgi:hypothetical protein
MIYDRKAYIMVDGEKKMAHFFNNAGIITEKNPASKKWWLYLVLSYM